MRIKTYTLRFIKLGKYNQIYLRYFVTNNKKGETLNIPCDVVLNDGQLRLLKTGNLGGLIQKQLYLFRDEKVQVIERFNIKNNTYPSAEQLRAYFNTVFSKLDIEYHINKYLQSLKSVKPSTKKVYGHALNVFKTYFINNLSAYSINEIVNKNVVVDYDLL